MLSDKIHKLNKNDIIIYPVIKRRKFAVCIDDKRMIIYKRKRNVGEYKHTTKTINIALEEAIEYCYNKLINEL